jgi:ferritin-like metal-binding protein YciE
MTKKEAKTLDELFHDTLKDIYFAEKKILATLPKMEKAAQASQLKMAFAKHKTETEGHVARLEKVFAAIDKKPQSKTCDAIVGITDEGAEIMKEYKGSPALDAGLLAAAQAVEHYEISRYGTLKTWANELGLSEAVGLLDQTLAEEKKTDATLTEIAESVVNVEGEAAYTTQVIFHAKERPGVCRAFNFKVSVADHLADRVCFLIFHNLVRNLACLPMLVQWAAGERAFSLSAAPRGSL